jgi:chromosome segregation ATPase
MTDLTTQILVEIRDELRSLNGRVDQTNGRIDQTNDRLDQTNDRLDQTIHRLDRLERRQVEAEVRISTEIVAVHGAIRELTDVMRVGNAIGQRVDDHERRLTSLEQKS